jgi:HNH endonuclease/NUMOD4 motif
MVEWRQIAEFPDYEISEDGEVRRLTDSKCAPRGYVLKPKTDRYGYLAVRPFCNGRGRHVTVHRLVALTFLGDPPTPEHQVAHFDGDHKHNHYSNLRWATARENTSDKDRHGRMPRGERHHKSKLSDEEVAEIRLIGSVSAPLYQYEIAQMYGVSQPQVGLILRGKSRLQPTQKQ